MTNPHSADCPAFARYEAIDFDPEECRDGDCAAAIADAQADAHLAPIVIAPAPLRALGCRPGRERAAAAPQNRAGVA